MVGILKKSTVAQKSKLQCRVVNFQNTEFSKLILNITLNIFNLIELKRVCGKKN